MRYVIRHKGKKFNTMTGKHSDHVSYGYDDKGSPARFFKSCYWSNEDLADMALIAEMLNKNGKK